MNASYQSERTQRKKSVFCGAFVFVLCSFCILIGSVIRTARECRKNEELRHIVFSLWRNFEPSRAEIPLYIKAFRVLIYMYFQSSVFPSKIPIKIKPG